jgi:hypothetical protein
MSGEVALPVSFKFLTPKVGDRRTPGWEAPSMPEVAINEDCHTVPPEDDIRGPRQLTGIGQKSQTAGAQGGADK